MRILDTLSASAEKNMLIDRQLLEELSLDDPITLRFYDWECPSLTYGYFLDPFPYLNLNSDSQWQIAKRPTGGGILFHVDDFAFSFFVPRMHSLFSLNTLENYRTIHRLVKIVLEKALGFKENLQLLSDDCEPQNSDCKHFCMAKPSQSDLILKGRKVVGGAQRKTKNGFLHQGVIFLKQPSCKMFSTFLRPNSLLLDAMTQNHGGLLPEECSTNEVQNLKKCLKNGFIDLKL